MELLARKLYAITYERIHYEPIREDFLRWYIEAYDAYNGSLKAGTGDLIDMTLDAGTEAREYEPGNDLHTAIKVVDEADEILTYIFSWVSILCLLTSISFLGLGFTDYLPEIVWIQEYLLVVLGLIFAVGVTARPFYTVLSRTLHMNEELIRQYNRELAISHKRTREQDQFPNQLVSFYIWNSSLCSTVKQPVVVVLGVLRWISPSVYGYISVRIEESVKGDFEDETLLKIAGREYERYQSKDQFRRYERS